MNKVTLVAISVVAAVMLSSQSVVVAQSGWPTRPDWPALGQKDQSNPSIPSNLPPPTGKSEVTTLLDKLQPVASSLVPSADKVRPISEPEDRPLNQFTALPEDLKRLIATGH